MSAKNLTNEVQKVWAAHTLEAKKKAMEELINAAHAKTETKRLALTKLSMFKSSNQVDKFAVNFMMSGEGMKV